MTRFPLTMNSPLLWRFSAAFGVISLAGCAGSNSPPPAVQIKTVERVVEVAKPCPAKKPDRPAKLVRPLPTDAVALAAVLGAKVLEYDGDGGFADRALAALDICTKVTP